MSLNANSADVAFTFKGGMLPMMAGMGLSEAEMMAGGFAIFTGPLKDNQGNEVIAAGTALGQTDVVLESMDYLVEGVRGQI